METCEIGKPFPYESCCPRNTNTYRVLLTENSFELVISLTSLSSEKLDILKNAKLDQAIYVNDHIPFILIRNVVSRISFNFSFNYYDVKEELREGWLSNIYNPVNLYIINSETGILEAVRQIEIKPETLINIKKSCQNQLSNYRDRKEVDFRIKAILSRYSTDEMFYKLTNDIY